MKMFTNMITIQLLLLFISVAVHHMIPFSASLVYREDAYTYSTCTCILQFKLNCYYNDIKYMKMCTYDYNLIVVYIGSCIANEKYIPPWLVFGEEVYFHVFSMKLFP